MSPDEVEVSRGGDHLSSPTVADGVVRPTRGQAGLPMSSYLALLRMGFTRPPGHPGDR